MKEKQSVRDTIKTIMYVLKLIYSLKKSVLFFVMGNSVFSSIRPFIPIVLAAKILDELLGEQSVSVITLYVGLLIGLSLTAYVLQGWFSELSRIRIIEMNSLYSLRMAQKGMKIDYEYIEDAKTHDLRRLIDEGNNMHGGLWELIRNASDTLKAVFEIIISSIIIGGLFTGGVILNLPDKYQFIQSSWMVIGLFAMILVVTAINGIVQGRNGKIEYKLTEKMLKINRTGIYIHHRLIFDYEKGKDFRLYQAGDMLLKRMRKFTVDTQKIAKKMYYVPVTMNASVSNFFNGLLVGFVYLFVLLKAFIGAITIGSVMMQISAIQRFYDGVSNIVVNGTMLRVSCLYFSNSIKYLELPPRKYIGSLPVEKREDHEYEIEFKNVSFKYPGTEVFVLKNISLSLTIGERLAVVGMNGAGKTTMIKLLCRLYDPTEGEILLNGIDIKKYDYDEYLELFSVVFQDFKLFAFPIGENVACYNEFNGDEIEKCLEEAGVLDRVQRMKKGIGTAIGKNFDEEGVDISGGEKQKIAIARALCKDASIIILDEPTAALDPISEFEIYSKFDHLVGNKTAIYISHRLSSCRFCHDIVVFHEGEIIQRGTHEKLIGNKNGKYSELWNAQAQYYQD